MTVHSFEQKARAALTPDVKARVEKILADRLEAWRFEWTEPGGEDDRSGVDVWIWLKNNLRRGVEVKNNSYGEVRLEYLSRSGEGIVGWTVNDRLVSDYVLNLWPKRFWLIDFPSLKAVAKANREKYAKWYGGKTASSSSATADWTTKFVPVPEGILLADIYDHTVSGTALTAERLCGTRRENHAVGIPCRHVHDWEDEGFGIARCALCGQRYEPAA